MKKTEKNEGLEVIVKAVYKSILKTYQDKKRKKESKEIVEDILDSNYIPEIDPDSIPSTKDSVLNKGKCEKCEQEVCKCAKIQEKGVDKLKKMCGKLAKKKSC